MSDSVHPAFLWFDGAIVPWESATLHATSTIWSAVQAVFEGVRAYWQPEAETLHLFRLDAHLRRLAQSARLVRMDIPYDLFALSTALPELLARVAQRGDTYLRLVAFPGERRMASVADEQVIHLLADTAPNPSHLDEQQLRHLMVSSYQRISENVMPPRVKSLANYRNSDLAHREARLAGYDGALLLNRHGDVAEGPWSSLFLVRDGVLITPDLTSDLLESITRDTLITLARTALDLPVIERRVARTELYLADEVFLCGTAAEIQPVGSVDRYDIGAGQIGPVTERLRALYAAVVHGREPRYAHWLTSVRLP